MTDTISHEVLPSGARYSSEHGYLTAADELRDLHAAHAEMRRDLGQRLAAAEARAVRAERHLRLALRRLARLRRGVRRS